MWFNVFGWVGLCVGVVVVGVKNGEIWSDGLNYEA